MSEHTRALRKDMELFYTQEQWDEVITTANRIIELMKNEPSEQVEIYRFRGSAHHGKGEYDLAISDFDRAIMLAPEDAVGYLLWGTAHYGEGAYGRAFENFDTAINLEPQAAGGHLRRGIAYYGRKNYDKAIKDLDKTIKLAPQDAVGYQFRGISYHGLRNHRKAIADLDKAVKLAPQDAVGYQFRGIVYHSIKNYGKAIADLDEAVELAPRDALGCQFRGMIYHSMKHYDKAIADFIKADEFNPTLKIHYPETYIALQIDSIHGVGDENREESSRLCFEMLEIIRKIQEKLFYDPEANEIAHYTSLHVLKKLIPKTELFRLYNAACMDDLTEGRVFFK